MEHRDTSLGLIDTDTQKRELPAPERLGRDWSLHSAPIAVLRDHTLTCLGAGEQVQTSLGFAERALPCHAIVVISQGRGRHTDGRVGEIEVVAPALITLRPGVRHTYRPDPGGWTEHWVLFAGSAVVAAEATGLFDPARPVVPLTGLPHDLGGWFEQLRSALTSPTLASAMEAAGVVHHLVAATAALQSQTSDRLLHDLRHQASESWTVAQRAHALGLDVRTLRSQVAALTGQSVHEVVITARIERATVLLTSTNLSVTEVAQRVGYDDPAYFSRLFTRRTTLSPTAFRETHRRET